MLAACFPSEPLDSNALPYRLEEVFKQSSEFRPVDLDGDGYDERVFRATPAPTYAPTALVLLEHDSQIIDQINYGERIHYPEYLDLEDDGTLEILVSFVRNDSLFASFLNYRGHELFQVFLTSGKPRQGKGGFIPWDPSIRDAFVEDVNNDGQNELITVIATGLARLPRGVWVHSLPEGRLLGESIIGAIPEPGSHLGDYDEDGRWEVLVATGASNNGAVVAGMDDRHSYILAFDLGFPPQEQPTVQWRREMGGEKTRMFLLAGDLDGDGKEEFLAFKQTLMGKGTRAILQLIDTVTGEPYREHVLAEPITGIVLADLDRDARADVITLGVSGTLKVLDGDLEVVHTSQLLEASRYEGRNSLVRLADADGDDVDEILVESMGKTVFLDARLRVKAVSPVENANFSVMRQGVGRPLLLFALQDGGHTAFRLVKNRFYLLYRYGPYGLWTFGVGLVLCLSLSLVALHRQRRLVRNGTQEMIAERSRAWRLMAQRVAHDLKNPLTSILLTSQRLQLEYEKHAPELAGQFETYSKRIEDRIEYLRRMTRNLMKFVDLETPHLAETDLNTFIQTWCTTGGEKLPPDVQICLKLTGDLPSLLLDQEQMQSVVENLIANAIEAMPEGGAITLATHLACNVQFATDSRANDYIVLEVRDTGIGVPVDEQHRLFDVGFSTTEDGTGLGLAIVKKIVADHHGHIEVESEEGVGSAFSIYLPVAG